jgi:hypothetical protein
MMRVQFWRFFLTLSLLLTLPMQGYAAARMASCDAVLAGVLAAGVSGSAVHESPTHHAVMHHDGMHDNVIHDDGVHHGGVHHGGMRHGEPLFSDTQHVGMQYPASPGGPHDATRAVAQDATQEIAQGVIHEVTHDGAHDSGQGANHTAHGTSCMSCTPCSPGAALNCVVPVASTFLSARVVPAEGVAPTSADLAHPERPPQVFFT